MWQKATMSSNGTLERFLIYIPKCKGFGPLGPPLDPPLLQINRLNLLADHNQIAHNDADKHSKLFNKHD